MTKILWCALAAACLPLAAWGLDESTVNKNVTMISGQVSADGKTEVREQLLEECLTALPNPADLEAVVSADAVYLKEIDGDPARNDFVQTYSAVIDLNYLVRQKVLFIVTSNTIPAQPPVLKEMQKNLRETKHFVSNPTNGDKFAGRSKRQYFFTTREAAQRDVLQQATAWLKQQAAVACKP